MKLPLTDDIDTPRG